MCHQISASPTIDILRQKSARGRQSVLPRMIASANCSLRVTRGLGEAASPVCRDAGSCPVWVMGISSDAFIRVHFDCSPAYYSGWRVIHDENSGLVHTSRARCGTNARALSDERFADFPVVSEGVGNAAHPPAIGLVGDGPDYRGSGGYGLVEDGVGVVYGEDDADGASTVAGI